MNFAEYAQEVDRTRIRKDSTHTAEQHLVGHALGIAGEAGEVADLIKKWTLHGHPPDDEKLAKELGDVLWYVCAIGADRGISFDTIATANVAKLRARYPNGFTQADSLARKDVVSGHGGRGEHNGNSVLSDAQRAEAVRLHRLGHKYVEIATMLAVTESTIRRIVQRSGEWVEE